MFALLVAASAERPPDSFVCDEDTVSVIAPATITRAFSVETEVGVQKRQWPRAPRRLRAYTLNFLDDRLEETGKPGGR